MATVILENVSAYFPIYGAQQRSLRSALFQRATGGTIERDGKNGDRVTVKALSNISLTLHDGDRVGLLGHNGAGKSTLLKLMAGIYRPVSGTIKVRGRVTPLFDTMPGLDGEDSGYENIITAGMLIGMTRQQIEAKIPEIEEFCELGEYLSLPVRTYSAGMTMRLGFALVTALDPGVLLMDEGFGTGDQRFAERAEARMKDFIGRSRIMVLASHSEGTIRSMCNKALVLESGSIVAFGPVDEICDQYKESVHAAAVAVEQAAQLEQITSIGALLADESANSAEESVNSADESASSAEGAPAEEEEAQPWHRAEFKMPDSSIELYRERYDEAECLGGSIQNEDGEALTHLPIERSINIKLQYRILKKLPHAVVPSFNFYDENRRLFYVCSSDSAMPGEVGDYTAACVLPPYFLNSGRFVVDLNLVSFSLPERSAQFAMVSALRFEVCENLRLILVDTDGKSRSLA